MAVVLVFLLLLTAGSEADEVNSFTFTLFMLDIIYFSFGTLLTLRVTSTHLEASFYLSFDCPGSSLILHGTDFTCTDTKLLVQIRGVQPWFIMVFMGPFTWWL